MTTETSLPSVLLIYTGGTIGMIRNPETGALESFTFDHLVQHIPELKQIQCHISSVQFNPPIDSSDMDPQLWVELARIIYDNYDLFDGFVVLHGSDTMAYTASAMSFALENLAKPVIFTGSQLPIGVLRTDGKENLITAIEIATAKRPDGSPMVPEVCILFQDQLLRGNRTTKVNAENFNAFCSHLYPTLADVGFHINFYPRRLLPPPAPEKALKPHFLYDTNVIVLTLFPGIQERIVTEVLKMEGLKAVVMKTFGTGNAPQREWFVKAVRDATQRGLVIINITQCPSGSVDMKRYENGRQLLEAGVTSGYDSTVEAAVTKLMFLLGHGYSTDEVRRLMNMSLVGEITLESDRPLQQESFS